MNFQLKTVENILQIPRIANVHFFEFPKGHETKNDKHPFCELIFVSNGHVHVRSEEYSGTLHKNEMIVHGANCVHSFSCPTKVETSLIIIGFECRFPALSDLSKKPFSLNETEVKQLAAIVKEGRNVFAPPYNVPVYDMVKKSNPVFGSEQMLRSLLEGFLLGLLRKYVFSDASEESDDLNFEINELVEYLDNNFTEHTTIDELAFLFRTNRSTLCKEFRLATGKTVNEYVTDKKIRIAKKRLLQGKKSITQIADELNFESVPYFCKFFKKRTGLTPSEFQKTTAT